MISTRFLNMVTLRSYLLILLLAPLCLFAQQEKVNSVTTQSAIAPADQLNQTDKQGKKQGQWLKKYSNGKTRYSGLFKDDLPVGKFEYFYETGIRKAIITHVKSGISSVAEMYDEKGSLQARGFYYQTEKDSLWVYYNNAKKRVTEERYRRGIPSGKWINYYPADSTIARYVIYRNGKKEGVMVEYFENQQVKQELFFVLDSLEGPAKGFYPTGQVSYTGFYKGDLQDGEWLYYTDSGQLKRKEIYQRGELIKEDILIPDVEEKPKPVNPSEDPALEFQQ